MVDKEENKAIVLDTASVADDTLLEVTESCPEKAIIVENDKYYQSCTPKPKPSSPLLLILNTKRLYQAYCGKSIT